MRSSNLKIKGKGVVSKSLEHTKRLSGKASVYREIDLDFIKKRLYRSSELFKKVRRKRTKKIKRQKAMRRFRVVVRKLKKKPYSVFLSRRKRICNVSIVSLTYFKLTREHLEGIRLCLRRTLFKHVVIYRRVFPWLVLHTKPLQVRMGKGKGSKLKTVLCFLKPGAIVFDVVGFGFSELKKLRRVLLNYLPFRFKLLVLERL